MTITKNFLPLAALLLLGGLLSAPAGNPDEKPKERPPENRHREKMREKFLENLPPEVRQRFAAARNKAMQDPRIQQLRQEADRANGAFFKAVREKMMEIDPELAEIVKKQARKDGKDPKSRPDRKKDSTGFAALTPEEHQKILSTREKAKADPAVQAAEKKKADAQSPEDRRVAGEQYRQAMQDAMLKIDPSLAPLLEKLAPKPRPPKNPPPAPEGEMMMAPPES